MTEASPIAWLPPMVHPDDYEHDEQRWLDACYAFYCGDFETARPMLDGRNLVLQQGDGCGDGRGEMFWHLTSEDTKTGRERRPERCRRIRWPKPLIGGARRPHVRFWRSPRPGQQDRLLIAPADFSYVVIVADLRNGTALLLTAFDVAWKNQREGHRKDWLAARVQ